MTQETTEKEPNQHTVSGQRSEYCEYCSGEHTEAERVPVVGGETIGQFPEPEPHVGVTGINDDMPETELWCPNRYEAEFGVDLREGQQVGKNFDWALAQVVASYINAQTVSAFVLGVTMASIVLLYIAV